MSEGQLTHKSTDNVSEIKPEVVSLLDDKVPQEEPEDMEQKEMDLQFDDTEEAPKCSATEDVVTGANLEESTHQNKKAPEIITDILKENVKEYFVDEYDEAYVRVKFNDREVILPCRSREFAFWFKKLYHDKHNIVPRKSELIRAIEYAEFMALSDRKIIRSNIRIAKFKNDIWYDLFDEGGRAVKIYPSHFDIENPQTIFKHTVNTGSQAKPKTPLDLDEARKEFSRLISYFNITDEASKDLLQVYIISCLVPNIPHPILLIHGEPGSGKSTTLRLIRELVDPSKSAHGLLNLPSNPKRMGQTLASNYFSAFDNVDRLQPLQSDLFCRAVSGGEIGREKLTGTNEEIVLSNNHCIALNGINLAATRSDLLDRAIIIDMERISPMGRKDEATFWSDFEKDRPHILGGMFKILSEAMRIYPELPQIQLTRMADFCKWGYAIAEALGIAGDDFLKHYNKNINVANNEAIDNSPVALAVIVLMTGKENYENTMTAFLKDMEEKAKVAGIEKAVGAWPKAANQIKKHLNLIKTNLNNLGISYAYGKSDKLETKNCSTIAINNTGEVVAKIFAEQVEEDKKGSEEGAA